MEKMAKFESVSRGQSILERCELDGRNMNPSVNVLGTELQTCSNDPKTGWYRDGCCNTDENDRGSHTVCCVVTDDFLEYALQQGNDLITPAHNSHFLALKPENHGVFVPEHGLLRLILVKAAQ